MIEVTEFQLRRVDAEIPRGQLLNRGGTTLASVDGTMLEAQFEVADGYLIVTTDGDPFEDALHLTLFDRNFQRRDRLSIGLPYRTGRFRLLGTGPSDRLRFSFFVDDVWQLDVLRRGRRAFRWLPTAVRRPGAFLQKHWLELERRHE